MTYTIVQISPEIAESLCREITADLPEYFGLPGVNEQYFVGVRSRENFAADVDGKYVGLLSVDFPYPGNCHIYWMGVLRDYQGQSVGSKLLESVCLFAIQRGALTMTVETLAPQEADKNYLRTYQFYEAAGFAPLFNLKPAGYEWNMVYMSKNLNHYSSNTGDENISIRPFKEIDISFIVASFAKHSWPKPSSTFEKYYKEQEAGERLVFLAYYDEHFAGYITIKWEAIYQPFKEHNIPEIIDLNVLPPFRGKGIGSELLDKVERSAMTKYPIVGLGVGLYQDYGHAQRLYVKRGYIPDGLGVTYNYKTVPPSDTIPLDDDLVLWFTKKLR